MRDSTTGPVVPMRVLERANLEIVWTKDAIRAFWNFLVDLRSAGRLGPLGLSFHAAPAPQAVSSTRTTITRNRSTANGTRLIEEQDTISGAQKVQRMTAHGVDHFKVYHDAVQSCRLRNVLNAWAFTHDDDQVVSGAVKKGRLLKGAILALLDEASRGVLTC